MHLVLKVLSRNERIQELLSALQHYVKLSASTTEVGIVVECVPKVKNRLMAGLGTCIGQDANLGVELLADSIE